MHLRLDRDATLILISDVHIPYNDPKATQIAVDIVRLLNPDFVFLDGDIFDLYPISDFSRDPAREQTLQYELDLTHLFLDKSIRKNAQNARIFYKGGNHEHRMIRYIWNKAKAFNCLRGLTVPELLRLESLDIEWLPQDKKTSIGELYYFHGDEFSRSEGGVYPARNIFLKAPGNIIMGHWHRITAFYYHLLNGKTYGAWSNGCLSTLHPEWMPYAQWQHGVSIVRYNKSGLFHVIQVPIFQRGGEYYCMLEGTLLTTRKPKPKNKRLAS